MTLTIAPTDDSMGVTHLAESEAVALRRHLRALRGLSDALARAGDLVELCRATQRETARILDAPIFFLALYDDANRTVEIVRQFAGKAIIGNAEKADVRKVKTVERPAN